MSDRTYLDHNATSQLRPEAQAALLAALFETGNPSSGHKEGRAARALIEDARETVAEAFGVRPSGVIFTSGGTEAANWLLQPKPDQALSLSSVEHHCVLHGHRFERSNVVAVDSNGVLDLGALEDNLTAKSVVAVQAANNETGVVQPLAEVSKIAKERGATLISDAVQAVGRVPLHYLESADILFFSAHKFGGVKGAGAVIFRDGNPDIEPLIRGGGQERRMRSGTENVAGIAALGAALTAAVKGQEDFVSRAKSLQVKLETGLRALSPDAVIFGERAERLPNTTSFAIPGRPAETLLISLDLAGIAVSSGAACSSGKVERSHVLTAMGVPEALCDCAIRVSTGWNTEENDIERFLAVVAEVCGSRERRQAA